MKNKIVVTKIKDDPIYSRDRAFLKTIYQMPVGKNYDVVTIHDDEIAAIPSDVKMIEVE